MSRITLAELHIFQSDFKETAGQLGALLARQLGRAVSSEESQLFSAAISALGPHLQGKEGHATLQGYLRVILGEEWRITPDNGLTPEEEAATWDKFTAMGYPPKVVPVAFGELALRYDPLWHCTGYEGYYKQATEGDVKGECPKNKEGAWDYGCHEKAKGLSKVEAAQRYNELVGHILCDPRLNLDEEDDEEVLLCYVQGQGEGECWNEEDLEGGFSDEIAKIGAAFEAGEINQEEYDQRMLEYSE